MKVKLTKGRAASLREIATLQEEVGFSIPPEFLEFIAVNDGAEPETNIFKIGNSNESGVNRFIPISEIPKEISRVENLPNAVLPVAWAEGGNYVLIDQSQNGAIFFWDHELPDDTARLADNFRSFLDLLEPFDVSTIKLKPGQVRKAWIDPDFLKDIQG